MIYSFSLAIRLRMIGTTHFQLGVRHLEQFLPQSTSENFVSVRYDSIREPMQLIHLLHICLSHCQSCAWVIQSYKMSILRELVHHYEYAIVLLRFRQSLYEIQRHHAKHDLEWVEVEEDQNI